VAEGEEILVKCNALCDANGPVLHHLYDAAGTPAQCTVDCAAAYGEFYVSVGKQNVTAEMREASSFMQHTKNHTQDTSKVLLKCYAECGTIRKDNASTCTMDCALRHLRVAGGHGLALDLRASWSDSSCKKGPTDRVVCHAPASRAFLHSQMLARNAKATAKASAFMAARNARKAKSARA
jgi:hypothetical protein